MLIEGVERYYWRAMYEGGKPGEHDDYGHYDFNTERLTSAFELIKLKFDFAHEFLQLNRMSQQLEKDLKKYEGELGVLNYMGYIDIWYSPVKDIFSRHLSALTSHIKIEASGEYETTNSFFLLEQILRGTPKILTDRKTEPVNEKEVKKAVYDTLVHVFPDTVREIPIAKVSKVYKPDLGVKRLKSAIEYKFVDTEQECKTVIGGVFEDIHGYEGSTDWTTFYAVIYMTDNFMTQDQITAEFKLSNVPFNWKPIVSVR